MLYSSRSGDVGPGKYGQVVSSGKKTWRGGGESFSVPLVAPGVVGFLFCMQIMSFDKSLSLSAQDYISVFDICISVSRLSVIRMFKLGRRRSGDSWKIHHFASVHWKQRWDFPVPLHWQFHSPDNESKVTQVRPNLHQLSFWPVYLEKNTHLLEYPILP